MSAAEADQKILQYLREQNRPYSATDVLNNLHKTIGKTQVVKSLEKLAQSGELSEKVYGKQKIYFLNQRNLPSLGESELKDLESKISSANRELTGLKEETKAQQTHLLSLNSTLTTQQARVRLEELNRNLERGKEKLVALKTLCKNSSPEDTNRVNLEHDKLGKEWRKRKRMCMDIVNAILESEGCVKSKRELLEEMGVETDEDCGVKLPVLGS